MSMLLESLRRALREAEMSQKDKDSALRAALADLFPQWYVWVCDVFPDSGLVVFNLEPRMGVVALDPDGDSDGGMYRLAFTVDAAGAITFTGTPVEVQRRTVYVPEPEAAAAESAALAAAIHTLTEAGRTMSAKNQTQMHDAIAGMSALHGATCDMGDGCPLAAPAAESASLAIGGDIIPLHEGALRADGTAPIKLIQPGWGSSGYYSPTMLERDGPTVFKAGTKMFWDHQTMREEAERPEGSLSNLAGEFTTDARWEAKGPDGPGLYADAKLFGGYRETVNELAPHIGVSIRAMGKAKAGEAEGRKGQLIEQLVAAKSVDFVTQAGAGGKVLEVFEAARGRRPMDSQEEPMSEKELTEARAELTAMRERETARVTLDAARDAEIARLREGAIMREARDIATAQIAAATLPDVTKARLVATLGNNPPVKEGALDRAAYATAIDEAIKAEAEYLSKVTGGGRISGMGAAPPAADAVATEAKLKEAWTRTYISQGHSAEDAERLAALSLA